MTETTQPTATLTRDEADAMKHALLGAVQITPGGVAATAQDLVRAFAIINSASSGTSQ